MHSNCTKYVASCHIRNVRISARIALVVCRMCVYACMCVSEHKATLSENGCNTHLRYASSFRCASCSVISLTRPRSSLLF